MALAEARALGTLDDLIAARDLLTRLVREATPAEKRTLTVAQALAAQEV
ncbi:MAG: hypothetical protein HZY75_13320 [Nocardioidaceae bacterium]|nr:MAG: hypothetical protein HZY75_13320 [Nocardioidaceae bacterium]